MLAEVTIATDGGVAHAGPLSHPAVGPQNRALNHRVLFDLRLAADDGVGADTSTGFDEDPFVDEARSLDDGAVLDAGIGSNGRAGAGETIERRRVIPAVHDVA